MHGQSASPVKGPMVGGKGAHRTSRFICPLQMRHALGIKSSRGMRLASHMRGRERRRGSWWDREKQCIAIEGDDFAQDTQEGGAERFEFIPDSDEEVHNGPSLIGSDDEFVPETEPQDMVVARKGRPRFGTKEQKELIACSKEEKDLIACSNTGTWWGCDGSLKHIVEVGGSGEYSPMSACCSCNLIRKHLVAEEGGCEGRCPRNLRSCDLCGSPKHVGRSRLRQDAKGQLYVLDSEAEDSELEESCRPVLRRGQGVFGHRLATTGKVALKVGTTKATSDAGGEMTEEMLHYMEQCLTGIEEANREVFIPWIKDLITSIYTPN